MLELASFFCVLQPARNKRTAQKLRNTLFIFGPRQARNIVLYISESSGCCEKSAQFPGNSVRADEEFVADPGRTNGRVAGRHCWRPAL